MFSKIRDYIQFLKYAHNIDAINKELHRMMGVSERYAKKQIAENAKLIDLALDYDKQITDLRTKLRLIENTFHALPSLKRLNRSDVDCMEEAFEFVSLKADAPNVAPISTPLAK